MWIPCIYTEFKQFSEVSFLTPEGFSVNGSVRAFLFLWASVFLSFSAGLCGCQRPYQRSGALMGYDREIESELWKGRGSNALWENLSFLALVRSG